MCLAIPSRIERIDGLTAVVDTAGERREVSLMLLDDEVAVGDYVLVQNGHYAYERLDAQRALEALALIDEVVAGGAGADLRAW